jgi:hypothetical protein
MKFNEEQRKQINDTLYHPTMSIPEMIDRIESILSEPDAERGKDSDERAMKLIMEYQQGPDDWLIRKKHVVSAFMTKFSASETSLLRAELCKANELYELYKRSFDKMEQLQIAGLRKIERLESELSAANQRISEQSEELRFRHDRIGQISHELLLANQRIAELEADVEEYRQLGMERSLRD